jgi:NAD-dependent SIR2 family protein deacetylase
MTVAMLTEHCQLTGFPPESLVEMYGSLKKISCIKCNEKYSSSSGIRNCVMPKCSYKLKPHCVFHDETMDQFVDDRCKAIIKDCDLLILIGVEHLEQRFVDLLNNKKV